MTEPILCFVILASLGWVIVLKTEIQTLKEDNRKLRTMLKLDIREKTSDVATVTGKKSWGLKPTWMK